MYLCKNCESLFEDGRITAVSDKLEFWGGECYITGLVCPSCESDDIVEVPNCDICGEPIIDNYIRTTDGKNICGECYTEVPLE